MRLRKRARALLTAAAVFCTLLLPVMPTGAETTKPTKIVVTTKVKNVAYAGTDSDVILALYDKNSKTEKTYKLDRAWWYNDFEKGAKDTYTVETEFYAWEISDISIRIKGKDALRLDYVDWDMTCNGQQAHAHVMVNTWLSNKESEKSVTLASGAFKRNVSDVGNFASAFEGTEYFATNDTTSGSRTFQWNCRSTDQYSSNVDPFTLPQPPEITYNISGKGKVNGAINDAAASTEIKDAVKDVVYKEKTIGFTVDKQKVLTQMKAKGIYKLSITTNLKYPSDSTNITKISSQSRTFTFIRPQFVLSDKDTAITTTPYTAGIDNYYFNSTVGTVTAKIAVLSDGTYMANYNANDIARDISFGTARLFYGRGSNDFVNLVSKSVSGNTVSLNFDMSSVRRNDDNTGLRLELSNVTSKCYGQTYVLSGGNYSKLFTTFKTDTLPPEVSATAADGGNMSGVWRKSMTVNPSVNEEVYPKLSSSIPFESLPFYKNVFSAELTGPNTNKSKNVAAAGASALTLECDNNIESNAFTLKLTAYDFAGNKTEKVYNNICLDRKAPSVSLSEKKDVQQADLSKAVCINSRWKNFRERDVCTTAWFQRTPKHLR